MNKRDYSEKNGKDKAKRQPERGGESYDAPFRGYVNLNLSPDQKELYEAWAHSASFGECLQAQVEDGVNISLKLDPKADGYLASATQRRVGSPNAGLVVTARAGDAGKALGRVLFCLAVLSHSERWEDVQPMADPDRW